MELMLLYSLIGFSLVIILGYLAEIFFDKTHIPDVLLLFLIGIFIGPVMNWVNYSAFIAIEPIFVSLALIIIIFEGSIHLKFRDFVKGAFPGTRLAFLFFIANILVVSSVMIFFGYSLTLAILLGAILGGVSSAVVIPVVKLLKLDAKSSLILTLESAISDVFCITGAITVIEIFKVHTFNFSITVLTIIFTFLTAILLGLAFGALWVFIRAKYPPIKKAPMLSIAYLILIYIITEAFNSNGAIAMIAFGIFLGNIKVILNFIRQKGEYHLEQAEKRFYSQISFFLKVFFFVYLGILIDFSNSFLFIIGFIIAFLVALIRPYIVKISINSKKSLTKEMLVMKIMTPKGLAAAVLAQISLKSPFIQAIPKANDLGTITLSVILFSILFTSILIFYYENKFKKSMDGQKA